MMGKEPSLILVENVTILKPRSGIVSSIIRACLPATMIPEFQGPES